ncbi:hypothetical protein FB45DRAFT_1010351 [Roridomyces roridus]|uniref:Uncharacterized protein n=1 Tax=Roridomyces roridus TaxID=1738132 RepID=A0AAD7B466_9AGAR|nr:hypothetical protein FB45DRAFT_1010351 [Roridomyces roridus]
MSGINSGKFVADSSGVKPTPIGLTAFCVLQAVDDKAAQGGARVATIRCCGAVVVMEAEAVGGYESADNPARSWSVVDGEGLRPLNTWWWLMTEFGRKTTNVNNALFFSLISPLSVPSSRQFLLSDTSSTSQQCYPTPSSQRRFGRGLEVLTGDLQPRVRSGD